MENKFVKDLIQINRKINETKNLLTSTQEENKMENLCLKWQLSVLKEKKLNIVQKNIQSKTNQTTNQTINQTTESTQKKRKKQEEIGFNIKSNSPIVKKI
ncbi:hypothetical protein M0811_00091 [Anaeramoeba ignava]|uniref:Uncharacterized protein n=1 Tax=Anaeramoeba ignava TaxID=1746090 RepID=A0A9Q0LQM3_ANAIG|nr:hypothetical protein M0811_00091 [Anaeramoeba ignava]